MLTFTMLDYIPAGILGLICVFVFLFIFWKNLKDDYIPSQIFSTALTILFFAILGYILSENLSEYRFWIIFLSIITGYKIGSKRSCLKFYEGLDSIVIAFLLSGVVSAASLYKNWTINWVLFYISIGLSVVVYSLIKKAYKTFIWYKSGKRGFPGLFTIGLFFLIRSIISFTRPDYTLMLTEYDLFFSGLISLISFLNIFILANK